MFAKPIVKWAGGKSSLLRELMQHVPAQMGVYAEPFAGGAALFFALAGRGTQPFKKAVLADQNQELVACYQAVRDDVRGLIKELGRYKYDKDLFYLTRDQKTDGLSNVERGARFIFLNRTCFNGLWRVNSSGRFNVPFGRYKNPRILDEEGLLAASHALKRTKITVSDFSAVTRACKKGDFVYLDPPYVPLSKTAGFTAYAAAGFNDADQVRLVRELRALRDRGARAMLSNADTPHTRELYREFSVNIVYAPRPINSNAKKRGDAREVLVTTWGEPGIHEAPRAQTQSKASKRSRTRETGEEAR